MASQPQTLRRAVQEKLRITRQSLDGRIERLRSRLPMSSEDAVAVIGFQNRVDIARWIEPESLARVATYVTQLKGLPTASTPPSDPTRKSNQRAVPNDVVITIAGGVNVGRIPGLSPSHAREAERMSEKVYPLVYLFENSARDVITRVLKAALGDGWWLQVPSEVSNQAALNMKKEGEEAWHSTRADPIQCVDLPQLKNIVKDDKLWPYFRPFFNRKSWFESVVDDINVSRRVVAHMNPLSADDIKSIETGFRKWVKQLQAHESELP